MTKNLVEMFGKEMAESGKTVGQLMAENIDDVEKKLLDLPQADCSVSHHFGPGLYIREVRMPAGIVAIGHEQKMPHMNVFISGKVRMLNADGSTTDLCAPMTFMGKPGRKIGFIIEDVVWQNIYTTDETDIETLEATYLNKSDYFKEQEEKRKRLANIEHQADRDDYLAMLDEVGVSHEVALAESENEADQIPMPTGWAKGEVFTSQIHGKGFFATSMIRAGEIIAPARIGGKRTPAGRYVNHAANPNAEMRGFENGDIGLVAIRDIRGCKGGILGEEITIDYRKAIKVAKQIYLQEQTK